MERLTDVCWKNLDPWECCGQDSYCIRGCHDKGGCTNGCIVPKLYVRLAAYEDTGLTPEEIEDLASVREISPEAEYAINSHADSIIERLDKLLKKTDEDARTRELAAADKEGRALILPCKVGDTVWRIVRDGEPHITRDEVRDMYFADDMTLCVELVGGRVTFTEKFGQTVFLTREEAERAMEGRE